MLITPIKYIDAAKELKIHDGTIDKAVARGTLTKYPTSEGQRLIKEQVLLFKGKQLRLSMLSKEEKKLWQEYEDFVTQSLMNQFTEKYSSQISEMLQVANSTEIPEELLKKGTFQISYEDLKSFFATGQLNDTVVTIGGIILVLALILIALEIIANSGKANIEQEAIKAINPENTKQTLINLQEIIKQSNLMTA